jgi:hypothetical protein
MTNILTNILNNILTNDRVSDSDSIRVITFDQLFSTWIFIWFLLYYFKCLSFSPKFWLLFVSVYATTSILYMIHLRLIPAYILITMVLAITSKIIPIYLIKNDQMIIKDILFGFLIGIIYLLWLYYTNEDVFTIYCVYMFNYNMPKIPFTK